MENFSRYRQVGKTKNTVDYSPETDPDIVILVPLEGTKDTAEDARENATFIQNLANTLGKPLGVAVIMSNMLSQDAEARKVYGEIDTQYAFAAALVVESALSRALGSFFVGLSRPIVPTKLFDSVDSAIEWLKTMRPKSERRTP